MCKIAAFFEGGMSYTELTEMPLDEFFAIIECANTINSERKTEMEETRRGK